MAASLEEILSKLLVPDNSVIQEVITVINDFELGDVNHRVNELGVFLKNAVNIV